MNKQVVIVGAIAVLVVGAVVGSILFSTRQNRVELTGDILKVRSHSIDSDNTVVVADMRVTNPSTQQFVVEDVEVYLDEGSGEPVKGDVFSEVDAKRLLEYYPMMGAMYNPTLKVRQKIEPGETMDRTVTMRFPGVEERVTNRKGLRVVVTDVDGAKTEIPEKR